MVLRHRSRSGVVLAVHPPGAGALSADVHLRCAPVRDRPRRHHAARGRSLAERDAAARREPAPHHGVWRKVHRLERTAGSVGRAVDEPRESGDRPDGNADPCTTVGHAGVRGLDRKARCIARAGFRLAARRAADAGGSRAHRDPAPRADARASGPRARAGRATRFSEHGGRRPDRSGHPRSADLAGRRHGAGVRAGDALPAGDPRVPKSISWTTRGRTTRSRRRRIGGLCSSSTSS